MAKRKSNSNRKSLDGTWWKRIRLEWVLVAGLIAVLVSGVAYGWRKWGVPVTQKAEFQISSETIEIPTQPQWIHGDVRQEAVTSAELEGLSIFAPDAALKILRAFEMHPWVARVTRVSKRPPNRVFVELVYRRPVAWVEIPPGVLPNNESGLLPVDGEGVLLPPNDFSADQVHQFIRISVVNLTPCGLPGAPWGDPRVASAAQIASLLPDDWQELGLHRIVVTREMNERLQRVETVYKITSRRGAVFVWGSAPGHEQMGEPTAYEKKERLAQLAKRFATDTATGDLEFDLRDPRAGESMSRTAESPHAGIRG